MTWPLVVLILGIVWAFVAFGYFAVLQNRTKISVAAPVIRARDLVEALQQIPRPS